MWQKKDDIGLWIWIPENFKFYESIAFFTIKNNILDQDSKFQYAGIAKLKDLATIIIYENGANDELIYTFNNIISESVDQANIIGIFSFKKNRYSKPYTGSFEFIEKLAQEKDTNFKFKLEWSIMVSSEIGVNLQYKDRAFAYNIGIQTVVLPSLFFLSEPYKKIKWSWPKNVLTSINKKKIFQYDNEQKFADFTFADHINIVIITGPPTSGKTILGQRICKFIGNCQICKNEIPPIINGKSLVIINESPTLAEKQKMIYYLMEYNKPYKLETTEKQTMPNLVWIEMNVSKQLVMFLRHLQVQVKKQSCPILRPNKDYTDYYKTFENLYDMPPAITRIHFKLVLKKIPELEYIY